MKAIVQERYGPPEEVLRLVDESDPVAGRGEVLVEVHASAVAGDDWHLVRGLPLVARGAMGWRRPRRRVPGRELAGVVRSRGEGVTGLAIGDEVFGWGTGAFAELVAVSATQLARKPPGLTFEAAAVTPISGFTALQALRDAGRVTAGQEVLVLGASGGVGTFAVQLGNALGARVVGVCSSASVALVRSLGAQEVLDYSRPDFSLPTGRFDVVVDLTGAYSLAALRRALTPRGTLVLVGSSGRGVASFADRWFKGTETWIAALLRAPFTRQRLVPLVHADRAPDLEVLREHLAAGRLRPVVSAVFHLAEVPRAIGHFGPGHARGKVAIRVP